MSFGGGSGGGGSIASSSDVALNNPANNQVLTYNTGVGKWQNQSIAGGGAAASSITYAPDINGDLAATDVQAALTELDAEKAPLSHGHDASEITSGQLLIDRLAPGSVICVDKAKAVFGSAGSWPTSRPTSRTDIVVVWKGDTDPGTIALAGDEWKVTA